MIKMILFTVLIFIQITGSRAVTDVFVQTGDDFTLQLNKDKVPERFKVFAWAINNNYVVSFTPTPTPTHDVLKRYKGRVEIVEKCSVKLKNLQKTDSGIYEAQLIGIEKYETLAEYNITVEDPASPVVLTVDSVSKSSDSCNMTVSCRTRDSDISSTLTCDTQTCSQEGGQRSKVTATGDSLRVSVVNNALICNHSNLVSWTKYQETTKTLDLCINSAAYKQRVLVFTISGSVVGSLIVFGAVVFCLLKKRERRRRLKSSRETTNANQDLFGAAERENPTRTTNASLSGVCCLERPHNEPRRPTGTREPLNRHNVQVPAAARLHNPTSDTQPEIVYAELLFEPRSPSRAAIIHRRDPEIIYATVVPRSQRRNQSQTNDSSVSVSREWSSRPQEPSETGAPSLTMRRHVECSVESPGWTVNTDDPLYSMSCFSWPDTEPRVATASTDNQQDSDTGHDPVPTAANIQKTTQTEDVSPSCSETPTEPKEPTETKAPPKPKRTFAYVPPAAESQNPPTTDEVSPSCSETLTEVKEPTETRKPPVPKRRNVQVATAATCQSLTETNQASVVSRLHLEGPHIGPNTSSETTDKPQPESLCVKVEKP